MARNKGQFQFAANFEVKAAAALDPRVAVATKAELISKETWPYDGDTIYLYKGILVSVQEENAVYMLVDTDKILSDDYSGWKKIDNDQVYFIPTPFDDNSGTCDSTLVDTLLEIRDSKVIMARVRSTWIPCTARFNGVNSILLSYCHNTTEVTIIIEGDQYTRSYVELATLDYVNETLTKVYKYQGSKGTYAELPTDAAVGDVWNVAEAYEGHPAGTNYAWTGTEWDALAGSVDLSGYYNKDEVDAAIKVETERAVEREGQIAEIASSAKTLAESNKTSLDALSVTVGDINLLLNGNDDPNDDIPDQLGVVGRLEAVEELIGTPSDEDKTTTMLSRLNALEELVTGGESGEGEADQTLLQKVNQNTLDIAALEATVYGSDGNSGLVKAVETLNGASTVEGSVDYKIEQAFAWVEVQ